jgi:hypothetical protein
MKRGLFLFVAFGLISVLVLVQKVQAKSYIAYISDSTSSSVIYWLAKEAGIFKNMGWI